MSSMWGQSFGRDGVSVCAKVILCAFFKVEMAANEIGIFDVRWGSVLSCRLTFSNR